MLNREGIYDADNSKFRMLSFYIDYSGKGWKNASLGTVMRYANANVEHWLPPLFS